MWRASSQRNFLSDEPSRTRSRHQRFDPYCIVHPIPTPYLPTNSFSSTFGAPRLSWTGSWVLPQNQRGCDGAQEKGIRRESIRDNITHPPPPLLHSCGHAFCGLGNCVVKTRDVQVRFQVHSFRILILQARLKLKLNPDPYTNKSEVLWLLFSTSITLAEGFSVLFLAKSAEAKRCRRAQVGLAFLGCCSVVVNTYVDTSTKNTPITLHLYTRAHR